MAVSQGCAYTPIFGTQTFFLPSYPPNQPSRPIGQRPSTLVLAPRAPVCKPHLLHTSKDAVEMQPRCLFLFVSDSPMVAVWYNIPLCTNRQSSHELSTGEENSRNVRHLEWRNLVQRKVGTDSEMPLRNLGEMGRERGRQEGRFWIGLDWRSIGGVAHQGRGVVRGWLCHFAPSIQRGGNFRQG